MDENIPVETLATIRTNTVTINDQSKMIREITFTNGSLVITNGQPYKVPPAITASGSVHKITLEAGRSKSTPVANAFNSRSGGKAKEYAPKGGGGTPDRLNFMFEVNIFFQNGGIVNVNLGQGSITSGNNWWIGGPSIFSLDKPRMEYTQGNQVYTFHLSGDHDTFNLKLVDIRPASPIKHVFVLMLENHSFDNMLALSGIPGIIAATTGNSNSYNGTAYPVKGNAPGSMPTDPGHEFNDVVEQLAGPGAKYPSYGNYPRINNSGFASNYATTKTEGPTPPAKDIGDIMKCFNTQSQLPVLYQLASQFVVCDQWFSSLPGPTWPNRFFLHGASSNGLDHSPSKTEMAEWESVKGFKYPHGSIFQAMNARDITWRLYHDNSGPIEGTVSQVSSLHGIELWDVHSFSKFESDVKAKSYPYQYTFIEPNYGDVTNGSYENGSSQHPKDGVAGGEALITKVYESIRNSPLWTSSMLIITYDEHGGFYDHYPPGPAQPPQDGGDISKYNKYGFTFAQYGVRVPAVVISPLIPKSVDHTIYDHASVLSTLEWLFGLPPLTQRDATAKVIKGVVPLSAADVPEPREDCPETLDGPAAQPEASSLTAEERAALDLEPVPDASSLMGFLGVLLKADSNLSETPEERLAAIARFNSVKTRGDARVYLREVMEKVQAEKAKRGM
jgi:phospholipase C